MVVKAKYRTTSKTVNGDLLTPITIFQRLQGTKKFILESSSKFNATGRYSFIGANPRKIYFGENLTLQERTFATNKAYSYDGPLLQSLKQVMPRITNHTEFPFTGGAIGYIEQAEEALRVAFQVYDTLVIFDHLKEELTIFHTNIEAEHTEPELNSILNDLFTPTPIEESSYELNAFELTHSNVEDGRISNYYESNFSGDAFALYRKLRVTNPNSHMFYIEFENETIIGSSPESLINVQRRHITSSFITNTSSKFEDLRIDQQLDGEMRLIELAAYLQEICSPESISIHKQKTVQTATSYETITQVEGPLLPTLHAIDALVHQLHHHNAFGYIGFNGQIDFTHLSRTITIRKNIAQLQTGLSGQIYTTERDKDLTLSLQLDAFRNLVNR